MKNSKKRHPFSKNKGVNFLGIGKQDAIKYFFGGNAAISIVVLVLIMALLAKEAFYFFPEYKSHLGIYRKSGKEFSDIAEEQLKYQKELSSMVTQLKQYELYHRAGVESYIPTVFSAMKTVASDQLRPELMDLKIAKKGISSKEIIWGVWLKSDDAEKQALAKSQKEELEQRLQSAEKALKERAVDVVPSITIDDLSVQFKEKAYIVQRENPALISEMKVSLAKYFETYSKTTKSPQFISDKKKESSTKRKAISKEPFFEGLTGLEKTLRGSYKAYDKYVDTLRDHTLLVSIRAEAFLSSAAREKAISQGIPEASEEKKKELMVALERLVTEEQDYDVAIETVYASLPEYRRLQDEMLSLTIPALEALPEKSEFQSKVSRRIYDELQDCVESYASFMDGRRQQIEAWRHDKKVSFLQSIGGFVFGKKWVANSSWQNFFGLYPLFGGSLFITIIAIIIATPFAVSAAIYVNRLASPAEQTIIKPIIEFIQAIPSVVLAFLGVVVVGQNILKLSYIPWLDWVPGFPANGEQMMLTAGVLLAFMAIPTMFTLAEDAINNVPKSYNEASLALGASKLQTIFRVIVPSSLSGIVGAVILGFGRIIGETMVVLLVAGGTINWPSTWTDPVHTMTGIIAQSTGEAAPGSIQYRALFLVGLVLFVISLILNSLAQRVIEKYGNRG